MAKVDSPQMNIEQVASLSARVIQEVEKAVIGKQSSGSGKCST